MRRILLVDDEINVLHALQRTLRQCFAGEDFRVEFFTDPEQALLRIGEIAFDTVVSDYRMPGMNGIDFLKAAKLIQPDSVRMVLSASTEFETVMNAVNEAEVFRYLAKPWQQGDIKDAFVLAFKRRDELIDGRKLADEMRVKLEKMTPQEYEARRLEEQEPGITKVNWGNDGSVRLDDDFTE